MYAYTYDASYRSGHVSNALSKCSEAALPVEVVYGSSSDLKTGHGEYPFGIWSYSSLLMHFGYVLTALALEV